MKLQLKKVLSKVRKWHIVAFVCILFFISLLSFLSYNKFNPTFKNNGAIYKRDILGRIIEAQKIATPLPTPQPDNSLLTTGPLVKIGLKEKELYTFRGPYNVPYMEYWDGYLFTTETNDTDPYVKLVKYDIETGEKHNVLVLDKKDDRNKYISISDIRIIHNKMLIILSDYMVPSQAYVLSAPTSEPRNLTNKPIGYIKTEKINNTYFLTGGFGDGCGGDNNYTLLNPNTLGTKFILRTHSGCEVGEEVLGTYKNYFIVALHEPDSATENTDQHFYRYLELVSFFDGTQKTMLLPRNKMPKQINLISLNKDGHTLEMKGLNIYEYDLSTNQLSLKSHLPAVFINDQIIHEESQFLCISHYTEGINYSYSYTYYKVATSDGSYVEDISCKQYVNQNYGPTDQERINTFIESLNSQFMNYPKNISLTIDGIEYH